MTRFVRPNLRSTIFFASALAVTFTVLALGISFFNFYRSATIASARTYSARFTDLISKNVSYMAQSIETYVDLYTNQFQSLASIGGQAQPSSSLPILSERSLVQEMTYSNLAISSVLLVKADGSSYYFNRSTGDSRGAVRSRLRSYVRAHLKQIQNWWGAPYWFSLSPDDSFVYLAVATFANSVPVYTGAIVVGIRKSYFESQFPQYKAIAGGALYVFNRNGVPIYSTDRRMLPIAEVEYRLLTPYTNRVGTPSGSEQNYLTFAVRPSQQLLSFVTVAPVASVLRKSAAILRILLYTSAAAAVLAFIVAWLISAGLTRDLRQLSEKLVAVTGGNLEQRVEIRRRDEIGELARSFNLMVERLKKTVLKLAAETADKHSAELREVEAEYRALQASVDPHFLYNILEAINSLAKLNNQSQISSVVEALSLVLRRTVADDRRMITLDSEIEYLRSYLALHGTLTGDRIQSHFEVNQNAGSCLVPKLILQPLVENAVRYAFSKRSQGGIVSVVAYCGRRLHIVVSDNGTGMTRSQVARVYETKTATEVYGVSRSAKDSRPRGFGLQSVVRRLQLLFGDDHAFQITSSGRQGTRIEIALPVRLEVDD